MHSWRGNLSSEIRMDSLLLFIVIGYTILISLKYNEHQKRILETKK